MVMLVVGELQSKTDMEERQHHPNCGGKLFRQCADNGDPPAPVTLQTATRRRILDDAAQSAKNI